MTPTADTPEKALAEITFGPILAQSDWNLYPAQIAKILAALKPFLRTPGTFEECKYAGCFHSSKNWHECGSPYCPVKFPTGQAQEQSK